MREMDRAFRRGGSYWLWRRVGMARTRHGERLDAPGWGETWVEDSERGLYKGHGFRLTAVETRVPVF